MKALYFAWVRERVGRSEEDIAPPPEVTTVGDLVSWLATRGDGYAEVFANRRTIRVALDKSHARPETKLGAASEIAFFPPMTGG
jgi:sulfur-carrier protein